jgi:hypothetical protein
MAVAINFVNVYIYLKDARKSQFSCFFMMHYGGWLHLVTANNSDSSLIWVIGINIEICIHLSVDLSILVHNQTPFQVIFI